MCDLRVRFLVVCAWHLAAAALDTSMSDTSAKLSPSILVHYHYHEPPPSTSTCEMVTKRTNFVMFLELAVLKSPKEVSFLITWSGHQLLAVNKFYESIGMLPPKRRELVPMQSNVVFHQLTRPATTDLCQRARALDSFIFSTEWSLPHSYDYVLFLNDSCRGPFVSEHTNPGVKSSLMSWLEVYVRAMQKSKRIAAVGQMSCEIDFHVMSWAIMFRWHVYCDVVHRRYSDSCSDSKEEVIIGAEIGSITAMLDKNYSIASLWPHIEEFSAGTPKQDTHLQRALRGCRNTLSPGDGPMDCWWWENMPPDLERLAFVKYGGQQLRVQGYTDCYVNYIESMTRRLLDVRVKPHQECAYTPTSARDDHGDDLKHTRFWHWVVFFVILVWILGCGGYVARRGALRRRFFR